MHPNTQRVVAALRAAGCDAEVVELTEPARTAAEAAALVGVTVGQIANSLVFTADGEPILVMTSGANRVDTAALGERLGATIARADADAVRAATGFPIGGVAPVGHTTPLRVLVDEDLLGYDAIWAAAGTPHTVFPTSGAELLRVTGGTPVRVTA
ncbi:MAG TPA: YbaK/EbsC family protein [Frankiaceae bacterium]|jgi:prolyl-tRNA editing enzyme YbaK/EbsC (Cys-tRNA(Pro) deacylase)|nr:YbaK/EbsC family protein [Frankiaceae bacterium]